MVSVSAVRADQGTNHDGDVPCERPKSEYCRGDLVPRSIGAILRCETDSSTPRDRRVRLYRWNLRRAISFVPYMNRVPTMACTSARASKIEGLVVVNDNAAVALRMVNSIVRCSQGFLERRVRKNEHVSITPRRSSAAQSRSKI